MLVPVGSAATHLVVLLATSIVRVGASSSATVILHILNGYCGNAFVGEVGILFDESLVDFHAELAAFERQVDHVGPDGLKKLRLHRLLQYREALLNDIVAELIA